MDDYINRINLLYEVMTCIENCEKEYTNSLFQLYNSISTLINNYLMKDIENPVSSALMILPKYFEYKYNYHKNNIEFLNTLIINPITELINETKNFKFLDRIKDDEKIIINHVYELKKIQSKYNDSVSKVEKMAFDYNYLLCSNSADNSQLKKTQGKLDDKIKESKEIEKIYIQNIDIANQLSKEYRNKIIEARNKIDGFIKFEDENVTKLNSILINTITDDLKKLKYDADMLVKITLKHDKEKTSLINSINKSTVYNYNNNLLTKFSESLLTFNIENYKPSFFDKLSNSDPNQKSTIKNSLVSQKDEENEINKNEINNKVLLFLLENFNLNLDTSKIKSEEIRKEIEFNLIIKHMRQDCKSLTDSEILKLKKILGDKNYIKKFVTFLNKERVTNSKIDDDITYKILSDIFMYILNNSNIDLKEDYEYLPYIIVFSHSFYQLVDDKKIFINKALKENKILLSEKLWINLIKYEIENELGGDKSDPQDIEESVKLKIVSNVINLIEFIEDYQKICYIVEEAAKEYGITKENNKELIDEVERQFKEKKEG